MNFTPLLFTILFTGTVASCSSPTRPQNINSYNYETDNGPIKIYISFFDSLTQISLTPEDVVRDGEREILIRSPESDRCARAWAKISQKQYYEPTDAPAESRVVVVFPNTALSFEKSGVMGTLNGQRVKFTPNVTEWFQRYIAPLQP